MKNCFLIIILSFSGIAEADNFIAAANLSLILGSGDVLKFESVVGPVSGQVIDPLLCRRAQLTLDSINKTNSEISYLVEQFSSRLPSAKELETLQALEMRRDRSLDFLSQPAPRMMASWSLFEISQEDVQSLLNESLEFELTSYVLDWGQQGSFFAPDGVRIYFDYFANTLNIILEGKLSAFCFSDREISLDVKLNK